MKKTVLAFAQPLVAVLLTVFLSCATTGNGGSARAGTAGTGVRAAPVEDNAVYGGDGLSLAEAIELSAVKIAMDLPAGSRVAFAAWESPNLGLSDYIMEELTGALVDRGMEVADRQNLEYVYRELDFQMSEAVSDENARSIGKFLGADLVITGQLTELGGPYRYRANAIHVENATRDSVTRLDVRGDAAMRRMVAALAAWKPAVKTASYGEGRTSAPGTAGAFLDRGIILAGQREFEMAIADFTEAIRLNPNLSAAYMLRGRAAYASVSDVYDIAENFAHVRAYFPSGRHLSGEQTRAYDRAIVDFTEALRLDGNNAVIYLNRGEAYVQKADYDKAIADFNQAIRHNSTYARAYISRGVAYNDKGDPDRAIADYNQAIKVDPNDAAAYHNRGRAYSDKGDYDRAIADYTQAIRLDPNDANAYHNRGVAYEIKKDNDRAIADYTQAIRLNPNDASEYSGRGNAYRNKGDYDRAIADYEAALRIDPNYTYARDNLALAYGNRGIAYANKNDYDRAIADYTRAIQIKPSAARYYNRGNAYYTKNDYDRAIADYEAALRINPNHANAYTGRGNAYLGKGDRVRARADWSKALELNPNNMAARDNLENFK